MIQHWHFTAQQHNYYFINVKRDKKKTTRFQKETKKWTNPRRSWVLPSSRLTQVAWNHYDKLQEITVNAILGDSKWFKLIYRILPFFSMSRTKALVWRNCNSKLHETNFLKLVSSVCGPLLKVTQVNSTEGVEVLTDQICRYRFWVLNIISK